MTIAVTVNAATKKTSRGNCMNSVYKIDTEISGMGRNWKLSPSVGLEAAKGYSHLDYLITDSFSAGSLMFLWRKSEISLFVTKRSHQKLHHT